MVARSPNICPVDRCMELFSYDEDSGELRWKVRRNPAKVGDVVGSVFNNGYRYTSIDGKKFLVHRIVWAMLYGNSPECDIDHMNGNRLDNRKMNLRLATRSQNLGNRKSISGKYKGVSWHKKAQKWSAYIGGSIKSRAINKKRHLGLFDTAEEASAAYMAAAREIYGEFARAK